MGGKKNSKYVGSCGIYVIVECGDGVPWLLVHRRSKQVFEANMIAGPGGIVERHLCVGPMATFGGIDFEAGAKATAVKELHEETGVQLDAEAIADMRILPVGEGSYWGEKLHRNYCAVLSDFPEVVGPEKASRHEIVVNGMDGIGRPAGDGGWNAWVDVRELLARKDLMKGCRVPLMQYIQEAGIDFDEESVAAVAPVVSPPAARLSPAAAALALVRGGAAARTTPVARSPGILAGSFTARTPAAAPQPIWQLSSRLPNPAPVPQEPPSKRARGS